MYKGFVLHGRYTEDSFVRVCSLSVTKVTVKIYFSRVFLGDFCAV